MAVETHFAGINLDLLGKIDNKQILDFGCGPGQKSFYFVRQGASIIGVDVINYLNNSEYKLLNHEEKKRFRFYDVNDFNVTDYKYYFDFIICREVLEHIPDTIDILKNFFLMLKENGTLIISIPSSVTEKIFKFFDKNWLEKCQHIHIISKKKMLLMAKSCGFKMAAIENQNFLSTLHWLFLVPSKFEHDMGRPIRNSEKYNKALQFAQTISSLPIIRRFGITFFPKSIFYYFKKI